jgi:hypothetical protein
MLEFALSSPRRALALLALGGLVASALTACPGPMPVTGTDTGTGGSSTTSTTGNTGGMACTSEGNTDPTWANWPMPNPLAAGLPNPASYTIDEFGLTVKDNVTGLIWERKSSLRTLAQTKTHCEGLKLNGVTGFRIPTRIELISLVDTTVTRPAIDGSSFITVGEIVGPEQAYYFWTSLPVPMDGKYQIIVDFTFGNSTVFFIGNNTLGARCVAGPFK